MFKGNTISNSFSGKSLFRFSCGLFLLSIPFASLASSYQKEIIFSTGMVSTSFSENESAVESSSELAQDPEPASASMSQIALDIKYNFFVEKDRSFYGRALAPFVSSSTTAFFMGAFGVNYFFNSIASTYTKKFGSIKTSFVPKVRYYWGPEVGVGYIVYPTETAEKSDVIFEFSVHGGLLYSINKQMGISVDVGVGRGTGVATSSLNTKALFGASYYY